jgi:hypothetical protein
VGACCLVEVLDVPDPEVASPTSLQGEAGLPLLLAGAKADLQLAFSGGTIEGLAAIGGLFTDELHYTSTFPTRIEVDRREIRDVNSTMEPIHRQLHRARALALTSAEQHEELRPNTAGHAESLNIHGYTLVLFAEHYCSGVPLSSLSPTGAVVYGEPQSTTQLLEAAVASFDQALAAATEAGDADQQNLARVGKARALLDLGRFADADLAAAAVPTEFVYHVFHSENSGRQQNGKTRTSTSAGAGRSATGRGPAGSHSGARWIRARPGSTATARTWWASTIRRSTSRSRRPPTPRRPCWPVGSRPD